MKAILVIDMPYYCCTCPFFRFRYRDDYDSEETVCTINGYVNENGIDTIASWCPLKPLPEEKNIQNVSINDFYDFGRAVGWNACLDEITGDTDESNISD